MVKTVSFILRVNEAKLEADSPKEAYEKLENFFEVLGLSHTGDIGGYNYEGLWFTDENGEDIDGYWVR